MSKEIGNPEDPADKAEDSAQNGPEAADLQVGPVVHDLEADESAPEGEAPAEVDETAEEALDTEVDTSEIIDAEIVEDNYAESAPEPELIEAEIAPPPPPPAPERRSGGMFSLLVATLLAAALGFILSYIVPRDALPSWIPPLAATDDGEAALAEQQASFEQLLDAQKESFQVLLADQAAVIEGLQAEMAAMADRAEAPAPEVTDLSGDIAQLAEQLAAMQGDLAGMTDRPITVEGDEAATQAIGALQAEIASLTERLGAIESPDASRVEALETELAEASAAAQAALAAKEEEAAALSQALAEAEAANADVAAKAAAATAMAALRTAVETGAPYDAALAAYGEATGETPPEALAAAAETGVTPLAILERDFADAARDALDASVRATMGDGASDRVGAFLRSQLKLRSLTPREGDDPDAVLSRAEAALRDGGLAKTLEELAALPEAGQEAMSDWLALASARQAALDAAAALQPASDN